MILYKDTNINVWFLNLGKYRLVFGNGWGIDKREYIPEAKKMGYINIFRT